MRTVDLIEKKRDAGELTTEEITYLINGYVSGAIPDYQIAALAMAIYYQGMSIREIHDLTTEWLLRVNNMTCQKSQVLRWTNIRPEVLVIK